MALSQLTFLSLCTSWGGQFSSDPADLSVLSRLSALRSLQINALRPSFVEGDPLPAQFHILRAATGLETIELKIAAAAGSWAGMPPDSHCAVQEAVAGLSKLSQLCIHFTELWESPRHRLVGSLREGSQSLGADFLTLLSLFTAAAQVRELQFHMEHYNQHWISERSVDPAGCTPEDARTCLSSLMHLCGLSLGVKKLRGSVPAPYSLELLQGLPSTQLTSLILRTAVATVPLLQEIARFHDLQELSLFVYDMEEGCFEVLQRMTGMSKMEVILPSRFLCITTGLSGEDRASICKQATLLKAALVESSRPVGFVPIVVVDYESGLDDSDDEDCD